MAATSVTGVSGDNKGMGSAEGQVRGTERMSLGVSKLIGPHVVFAESINLVSGSVSLTFPTLPGVATDYVAMADSRSGNRAYVSAMTTSSITVTGTGTDLVNIIVVRLGVA